MNAGFLSVTTGESMISPGSRLSNELLIDFLGLSSMSKIDFAIEVGGADGGGGGGGAASAGGSGGGGGNGGNDGGGGGTGTVVLPM